MARPQMPEQQHLSLCLCVRVQGAAKSIVNSVAQIMLLNYSVVA